MIVKGIEKLEITLEDIASEEQRRLAALVGVEIYIKIVREYGGTAIYIPKMQQLFRKVRDREIKMKFDGSNYKQLAREYDLTESMVRVIVADALRLPGQISFLEEDEK